MPLVGTPKGGNWTLLVKKCIGKIEKVKIFVLGFNGFWVYKAVCLFLFLGGFCLITISRSQQAPGSGFHHRDEGEKNYLDSVGPSCCNIKIDPVK